MLETRQQAIVQELIRHDAPMSGTHLAKLNGVSARTIREDIKLINVRISGNGAKVQSLMGRGYLLEIEDNESFKSFLQSLTSQGPHTPDTHADRAAYIICELLLTRGHVKSEDLADALFISRSTLQSDLKAVKGILAQYDLEIESKPNYGMRATGTEMNLRFCLSQYVFDRRVYKSEPQSVYFDSDELGAVHNTVAEALDDNQLVMTDIAINNLVIHIAIALRRIRDGYSVDEHNPSLNTLMNHREHSIAKQIVTQCETLFKVSFPAYETVYIALHLSGTKIIRQMSGDIEEEYDKELQRVIDRTLREVDREYTMQIRKDKELRLSLLLHLKPAINRYRYNMNVRNPMLADIRQHYPLAFEIAVFAGRIIESETDTEMDENEIGYIALHIGGAIERSKLRDAPKKCIVVCASGVGTSQLIYYKLKNHFGHSLEIIDTIQYYKLEEYPLSSLDFIISSIPIELGMPVPVIEVNAILNDKDLKKVESFIVQNESSRFTDYCREELVFINKDLDSRDSVLSHFDRQLRQMGLAEDTFLDSVMEREAVMPTSFGNLIAVPHPITPHSDETFLSFMTLKKPIVWGDYKVQLVCMLMVQKGSREDLQVIYDSLGSIIEDPDRVSELLSCSHSREFIRKINT
ncbi:BglG family transcription antiterminator [Salinicoccus halodurans]|uniref:Lichenan operon transcriptional antiterminator n=1 Tax=Salinicoccus halodurans TaxID=407035 RepID=A0A0F7HLS7_9STAP|nr:BglG family transcription antiterminator [Salinicoccus halodurans]AKG74996.1 hypothetical protein AAT16_12855 [Salinicoccus halodurans]SFK67214.1 lichenan operon transcriptional antiterminator [Salinicoccus halodurans]